MLAQVKQVEGQNTRCNRFVLMKKFRGIQRKFEGPQKVLGVKFVDGVFCLSYWTLKRTNEQKRIYTIKSIRKKVRTFPSESDVKKGKNKEINSRSSYYTLRFI